MKYCSTRGKVRGQSFQDALFTGYASDGGILLPETIPVVAKETLKSWRNLSFTELAKKVLPLFVSEEEIPLKDLHDVLEKAFKTFSCPEVAPVRRLKAGLNVLELFHGKTWAFKDLALSVVGQLYNYFCNKQQQRYIIVVGTSGDTGSAALEAVRGLPWVDIIVLLPGGGRCSRIQELQMTTVIEDNVHIYRVDGTSDDLDLPIKACFVDTEFTRKHKLTSINSINWARIMIQTVHYFYSYLQMCPDCDGEVEIAIPTGACGNVTSGCVARQMGLPVRFVCAVTRNDIVARALSSGDFSTADVVPTLSPAMDIQLPYNMERLWYLFSDGDSELVTRLMLEFEQTGAVRVPETLVQKMKETITDTFVVSDEVVKATMRRVWEENEYYICPHTAIAVAYHYQASQSDGPPRICIATASVAKFGEAVSAAGLQLKDNPAVKELETKPTQCMEMKQGEDWECILRQKITSLYRA